MNALITGGAGFIGSHLAEAILDARASRVVVLDDLSTGSRANLAALAGRSDFELVEGDVCDQGVVAPLVDRCEVVFHLAAAVGVRLIAECPIHTIKTNVNGTETVLAEAARHGRTVIVASTSEVYGKNNRPPFAEGDDTTLGSTQSMRWSYACSKLTDEFLALAYHQQRDLPVVICRLFNTIGPRQQGRYGMVVPRFIRQALDDAPLEVYGTGRQTRCFCHVADTVRALLLLASCPEAVGQVVNVGSDESVSIRQLAECIVEMTAAVRTFVPSATNRPTGGGSRICRSARRI
jgi:UDP-glucose 4-epimerase